MFSNQANEQTELYWSYFSQYLLVQMSKLSCIDLALVNTFWCCPFTIAVLSDAFIWAVFGLYIYIYLTLYAPHWVFSSSLWIYSASVPADGS